MRKDCANCVFGHHLGNRCGFKNFGCVNRNKWAPSDGQKLFLIMNLIDKINKISCNTCRQIKKIMEGRI